MRFCTSSTVLPCAMKPSHFFEVTWWFICWYSWSRDHLCWGVLPRATWQQDAERCGGWREAVRPRGGATGQREDVEEGRVAACRAVPVCASACWSERVRLCARANAYISPSLSLAEYDRWRWYDCARDDERAGPVRALPPRTCHKKKKKKTSSRYILSHTFKIPA